MNLNTKGDTINIKKILLITMAIVIVLSSIGLVSAEDSGNATLASEATVPDEAIADDITGQPDEGCLQATENEDVLTDDVKSFSELKDQIDNTPEGQTLKISGYYKGTGNAITISKDITIEGTEDNTVLDADGKSGIFRIIGHTVENNKHISYKVTFKNIVFKNGGVSTSSGYGGAIYGYHWDDTDYQTAYNCKFINCKSNEGGALNNFNAVNCEFRNNKAGRGGAMYMGSASNCKFINNTAIYYGGAIYQYFAGRLINKCTFTNNNAPTGGAIYSNNNIVIKNSYFRNNQASTARDIYNGTAYYCTFADFSSNSVYATKIINTMKPQLKITQYGMYGSKIITVKVTDTNNDNKLVSGATVTLKFSNGKTVKVKTNSKGIATYNMAFPPKTYRVTASLNGVSASLSNVKIIKTPANIIAAGRLTTYYGDKYFNVKVISTKNKKGVAGARILLKVYTGKKSKNIYITTAANGIAQFNPSSLTVGKHKVIVSSATPGVSAKAKTSQITLLKTPANIVANKLTFSYGKSKDFAVKLINTKTKKGVQGAKLLLRVYTGSKYQNVYLTTNANGIAKFNTAKLTGGTHKVVVSSTAPQITAKVKTSQVTVTVPTYITQSLTTKYLSMGGSVYGFEQIYTVRDVETKNPIPGAILHIYVNSNPYANVTSGNTVQISPATCAVTILYNGNSKYESCAGLYANEL